MLRNRIGLLGLAIVFLWLTQGCGAPVIPVTEGEMRITPADSLPAAVAQLQPGQTLTLAAGIYPQVHLTFKEVHGRADAWITVRGEPGARVVFAGEKRKRLITVDGCSFLRFENLEIGPGGWDAFKFFGVCNNIVVENCYVHDMGGGGINCSGIEKMTRLRVSHCHIEGTGGNGEGMYLGHQDGQGKCVYDSIFEYNLVHDTGGDQGDGIELNEGGLGNVIRHNVVFNTNYPCIFVENRSAGPTNLVYGNICWNSNNEAMQINGNAIVKDNLVLGGKVAYALAFNGVIQERNHQLAVDKHTPDEMLALGLAMIRADRPDSAAARADGLQGDGFKPGLGPRRLAEADGGKQTATDLAERVGKATAFFRAEARATIRQQTIERLVSLLPGEPAVRGYIAIGGLLTTVEVTDANIEHGVAVRPLTVQVASGGKPWAISDYGEVQWVPWVALEDNLLGRLLAAAAVTGGRRMSREERLTVAYCFALGGWSYQLNNQLSAIEKEDSEALKQFQAAVEGMLDAPLPPSEPREERRQQREEKPPQDLAPAAQTEPVAKGFAVD